MKWLVSCVFVLLAIGNILGFQTSVTTLGPVSSATTGVGINEQRSGTIYHQIVWTVAGTISSCTVALDSSSDGITWSAGGVITGQTCTSNGSSTIVNSVINNVRINVTALSGGGSLTVTYQGFNANPPSLSGNNIFTGNNTLSSIDNVKWVDGTTNTTIQAAVNAAGVGGHVEIPPNYTETLSANLTLNKAGQIIHFNGCNALITQGANQVLVTAEAVSVVSDCPQPLSDGGVQGPTFGGYTGTGVAYQIGSSSSDMGKYYERGILHDCASACGSGAVAEKILRIENPVLDHVGWRLSATNANTGLATDGTGTATFVGGQNNFPVCIGSSNNSTCFQYGNLTVGLAHISGYINMSTTGTKGIYCTGTCSSIFLGWPDIQQAANCLSVDSTTAQAVLGYIRFDSGCNTSPWNFSAATSQIDIVTQSNFAGTDSGTKNSVRILGASVYNDRFWLYTSGASQWSIADTQAGAFSGITLPHGVANAFINTTSALIFNAQNGGGYQFQNNGTNEAQIDGSGNVFPSAGITAATLGKSANQWHDVFLNGAAGGNATAGAVGELISSTIATGSSISLSTGTTANVTSVSLTAGDWDCTGAVDFTFGATTSYTNLVGGISTTSATLGGQDSKFDYETAGNVPTATADATWVVPTVRESLASTTTVFLVSQATFTVSTLKAYGTIRCRRVR